MLIIGLGNPGLEYRNTRHNAGFWAVDFIASELGITWQDASKMSCMMASGFVGTNKVVLIKPTTYMNLSGNAVSSVQNYYKIALSDIIVIHDDLDISCGSIKYKLGGGSGGHNGIKSIDQHIGNMYHRIRIGIGKSEHIDTSNYVLSDSTKHEREAIDRAISIIAKSLPVIISHDFESFKHTVAIESKKSSIE